MSVLKSISPASAIKELPILGQRWSRKEAEELAQVLSDNGRDVIVDPQDKGFLVRDVTYRGEDR